MTWLDAVAVDLDPVVRARALAAALPGAGYDEAVFDAPYDQVWGRISDIERAVPAADWIVGRIEIRDRRIDADGVEHLRFMSWAPTRLLPPLPFTARMEDGFCLMQAAGRVFTVVMAARPEGEDRTRFFHCEAVPRRGAGPLRRFMAHNVRGDIEGFRRVAEGS